MCSVYSDNSFNMLSIGLLDLSNIDTIMFANNHYILANIASRNALIALDPLSIDVRHVYAAVVWRSADIAVWQSQLTAEVTSVHVNSRRRVSLTSPTYDTGEP